MLLTDRCTNKEPHETWEQQADSGDVAVPEQHSSGHLKESVSSSALHNYFFSVHEPDGNDVGCISIVTDINRFDLEQADPS